MIYKIKKGRHYCSPFPFPKFKFKKCKQDFHSKVIFRVRFDSSCEYEIQGDQSDVNKLFGWSYGRHHYQSDRIGWRYNPDERKIELVLYSYEKGKRLQSKHLKYIELGELVKVKIDIKYSSEIGKRSIGVYINDIKSLRNKVEYSTDKFWYSYTLGLYFGGNRTAPHDMEIEINQSNLEQSC